MQVPLVNLNKQRKILESNVFDITLKYERRGGYKLKQFTIDYFEEECGHIRNIEIDRSQKVGALGTYENSVGAFLYRLHNLIEIMQDGFDKDILRGMHKELNRAFAKFEEKTAPISTMGEVRQYLKAGGVEGL